MKDKFKKITRVLSKKLETKVLEYFVEALDKEENTSDIINLVLSANLSATFNLMLLFTEENPEMRVRVNKFIDDLQTCISKMGIISTVEFSKDE